MKERPILFSEPMVIALLNGTKTQTRRMVKPQPEFENRGIPGVTGAIIHWILPQVSDCPHGKVGDRLYVREEHYRFGHWEPVENQMTKSGKQKWRFVADNNDVLFDAPVTFRKSKPRQFAHVPGWYKRLARFMPKALSRTTLEIVDVRIQMKQDISEKDAAAEGIYRAAGGGYAINRVSALCGKIETDARVVFHWLWESINGAGSWDVNPWVWAIEFKRVQP